MPQASDASGGKFSDALMAFIELKGIKGESTDTKHGGWCEILSFTWGVHQHGGADRADFDDFTFTKVVDSGSPAIYLYCARGSRIATVTIHVCTWKGEGEPYLSFTLRNAMVSSAELIGEVEPSGAYRPIERVSLRYTKIEWECKPMNQDGSTGAGYEAGWDLETNTSI